MKKVHKLIVSVASVALVSTAFAGFNNRLVSHNNNDATEQTKAPQLDTDRSYASMQSDNAIKPVRKDIASKVEVTSDYDFTKNEPTKNQLYQVDPANKAKSFPDAAKTGECYGELVYPAEFITREERIMTHAAYSEIETTPAQYEWVEEQVVVKEAETRMELVPATYKTIEERVLVEPERTVTETIPASFRTEEKKVLVQPASREWVDGEANVENSVATNMTGDLVCLIETPAKYETVSVQVIDQAARTQTRTIPAKYETIERTVVDVPAHTREVTVPAEYATVSVRKLVEPEQVTRNTVEPQYTTVTRYVESKPAYTQWERVFCNESIEPALAFEIEQRLNAEGFNPGPIDGNLDADAEKAINNYQMDQGLAKGAINPRTLESLGIVDFSESDVFELSQM